MPRQSARKAKAIAEVKARQECEAQEAKRLQAIAEEEKRKKEWDAYAVRANSRLAKQREEEEKAHEAIIQRSLADGRRRREEELARLRSQAQAQEEEICPTPHIPFTRDWFLEEGKWLGWFHSRMMRDERRVWVHGNRTEFAEGKLVRYDLFEGEAGDDHVYVIEVSPEDVKDILDANEHFEVQDDSDQALLKFEGEMGDDIIPFFYNGHLIDAARKTAGFDTRKLALQSEDDYRKAKHRRIRFARFDKPPREGQEIRCRQGRECDNPKPGHRMNVCHFARSRRRM